MGISSQLDRIGFYSLLDKKAYFYSLSNDDQQTRVDALRKVVTFATEIGVAATYEELLPLLKGLSQEDEDEVLLVLAEEMGKFYACVDEDGLETVLLILEALAKSEDAAIRNKAIEAMTLLRYASQNGVRRIEWFIHFILFFVEVYWLISFLFLSLGLPSHSVADRRKPSPSPLR
jgi:hypothetical protein